MRRSAVLPAPLVLVVAMALPAAAAEIPVTGPGDTALAVAIDTAVETARQAIGACRDGGGTAATCLCEHRDKIAAIRETLDAALSAHPEWESRAIAFEIGADATRTLLLNGVAKMAEPPECN